MRRLRSRRRRGFSLIEVMASMGILAVGLLGVLQMQVFASAQNGAARRTTQAAALLRDFQETARSIPWGDPRFEPGGGCYSLVEFNSSEALIEDEIGYGPTPPEPMHFTALQASDPHASALGTRTDGLGDMTGARTYSGLAATAFRPVEEGGWGLGQRGYQLAWSVFPIDTNGDGACDEARIVQFMVRFQVGQSDRWRSYMGQTMQYNPNILLPGGMFDAARMEAW